MSISVLRDPRIDNDPHVTLKRDDSTGIAWIEDGHTGTGVSVHPNISVTGNLGAMKKKYWGSVRTARSHGWHYNLDSFLCDPNNLLEVVVADHCRCKGCQDRRQKTEGK